MGIISVASWSYKLALRKIKHLIWTNQIHEVTEKSDFSWQHYLLSLRLSICFRFCWRWQILNQNTESETNPYDNLMMKWAGLSNKSTPLSSRFPFLSAIWCGMQILDDIRMRYKFEIRFVVFFPGHLSTPCWRSLPKVLLVPVLFMFHIIMCRLYSVEYKY